MNAPLQTKAVTSLSNATVKAVREREFAAARNAEIEDSIAVVNFVRERHAEIDRIAGSAGLLVAAGMNRGPRGAPVAAVGPADGAVDLGAVDAARVGEVAILDGGEADGGRELQVVGNRGAGADGAHLLDGAPGLALTAPSNPLSAAPAAFRTAEWVFGRSCFFGHTRRLYAATHTLKILKNSQKF